MQSITIPAITLIVYVIAEFVKSTTTNEKIYACIPPACGILGASISVIIYTLAPDCIVVENVLQAIEYGILSGLAATGTHQIVKQIKGVVNNGNGE